MIGNSSNLLYITSYVVSLLVWLASDLLNDPFQGIQYEHSLLKSAQSRNSPLLGTAN
jgi:hypothetical protein